MFKGKKYKVSERRYKQVMDEVKDRVEYVAEHNTQGLDAEDAHRAFVKFRQTLQASTEEAVARINGWLERLAHRKQSNYPYRRFRSSTNF